MKFKHQAITMRGYRKYLGLTQTVMAKTFGYTSPQIISNIERGIQGIPIAKLKMFKKDRIWYDRLIAAIITDVHASITK